MTIRAVRVMPVLILFLLLATVGVQQVRANSGTTLFEDDFNRPNSSTLDNGWIETETSSAKASIGTKRLLFATADDAYAPVLSRSFAKQTSGLVEWTYDFDWSRNSAENTYEILMQLGDNETMGSAQSGEGIAANIKWSGVAFGMETQEGLGYVTGSGASVQVAQVSGQATIQVRANLNTNTFSLDINPDDGIVEAENIPFAHDVDIDNIRLFANSLTSGKFSGRAFDNFTVKHFGNAPTEPEEPEEPTPTAPMLSGITASDILVTSASVSWQTDVPATGHVSYGATDCACDAQTAANDEPTVDHLHYLESLEPDTTYYYKVTARGANGAVATSSVQSFTTAPLPDTTPPGITDTNVNVTTTNVSIHVDTNEPTTATLHYGTTDCACELQTARTAQPAETYTITLPQLQPETTYYYKVVVYDAANNTAESAVASFTTPAAQTSFELLHDDFERNNNNVVGNGWSEHENGGNQASVQDGRLQFNARDDEYAPLVARNFTKQTSGTVEWTFDLDWGKTGNENNYEVVMQLGDSDSLQHPSLDDSVGSGVTLKWASPSYGMDTHEGFGYENASGTAQLTTLSGNTSVRVVADLDAHTFSIDINPGDGIVEGQNIPFTNNVPLDTIRLYAHALNGRYTAEKWFDNIRITSGIAGPTPTDTTPPTIQNMQAGPIGSHTATIKWETNEPATSQVAFGTSVCPCTETTPLHTVPKTSHSMQIGNLTPNTTYYFQVISTDVAGNESRSQTASFTTPAPSAALSVVGNWLHMDGEPLKLMGVRTASATQDQEQTDHLIAQLDDYKAHGINAVTVFYMGSRGANYDPFSRDGRSIDAGHQARMEQIIQAAAARDMVVIVGIFYQNARIQLESGEAFVQAVRSVAAALSAYDNVIINIANEQNSTGYRTYRDKIDINAVETIRDLAAVVHDVDPNRIVGGGGYDANRNRQLGVAPELDVLLFDTGGSNRDSGYLYDYYVAGGVTKPMVNVEMFGGYTNGRERGVFDESYKLEYTSDVDRAIARAPLGLFFHNGPWMQLEPMRYDLGGYGTTADPGIRWYFEHVQQALAAASR